MGKKLAAQINGMSIWAKLRLITLSIVLTSIFMHQGWYRPLVASALEMASNGTFNGITSWTFATATYDSTVTRTAGSGSAKLAAAGRNTASAGTVTQTVSIPAGSTVSAVSLYTQLTTSHEVAGDSVSVSLRYADNSTVPILTSAELTNGSWTPNTASPGLTLAQDVNQIIIDMNAKAGNNAAATANLWADELTITYAAGSPCTANEPTLSVSPTSSLVTAGANMLYTVSVTNNDSGGSCGNVTYNLGLANSNTTNFTTSALSSSSLSIGPGAQGTATFTVTAGGAAPDGAINTSTVSASANLHAAPPNVTAVTTVNSGDSPLMHTSANLDPTNIKGYGTWGADFSCNTCHSSNTNNVKRVAGTVTTSLGSRPVIFSRMTASVANTQGTFGDDLRTTYANASRNVCEVCHHRTIYHQYSSTKILDRSTNPHYNRKDCISCHPHNAGFKGAGCDGCHGNPPTSTANLVTSPEATLALGNPPTSGGSHAAHVTALAMKCAVCHSGNTMPAVSKTIQMGFDMNNTTWPGFAGNAAYGSFSGHSPLGGSPAYTFVSSKGGTIVRTSTSYRTSCNVYCHGQWPGANGSINPSWIITDGSQSACGTCHAATAAAPPQTGKHVIHASNSAGNYGFSCTKCHANTSGANHVNGSVQWRLSSSTTGVIGSTAVYTPGSGTAGISGQTNAVAPSATYGTCTNIYCHSTAQASNGTATPVYTPASWSGAALSCGGCHLDMDVSASATGDHVKHAQTNAISCATCHNGYTESAAATATHVNKVIELSFSGNAAGTAYSQGNGPAGNGFGTCSTSYCHSTGQSATGGVTPTYPATPPTWGTTVTNCGSCHVDMDSNAAATGDHVKHAQTNAISCATCHSGYTETSVTTATHVNKLLEVSFTGNGTGTTYAQANAMGNGYGSCSNSYCHSNGQSDNAGPRIYRQPVWGTTVTNCGSCHNNMKTFANASSGSHKMHSQGNANYDCVICHSGYSATTVNTTTHIDREINLGFTSNALNTVYSKYSATGFATAKGRYGSCSKSSCHGGGKPLWGGDTTRPTCFKCHGSQLTTGFTNVSAASVAPGYNGTDGRDTAGNTAATSARVGTHQGHLVASNGISDKIHCGECHTVLTTVTAATHLNYTTATVTFGPLAKSNAASPSVSRTSGIMTCSNLYCHGGKMPYGDTTGSNKAPAWNATGYLPATVSTTACGTCHGFPPPTAAGHPGSITIPAGFPTTAAIGTTCNCHSNVKTTGNSYATMFTDKTLHINANLEVDGGHAFPYSGADHMVAAGTTPWGSCVSASCHANTAGGTYPVASGVAPNCTGCHIYGLKTPSGTSACYDCHGATATNGMPNGAATAFPNWSGSHRTHVVGQGMACTACHNGGGTGFTTHGHSNRVAKTRNTVTVSSASSQFSYAAATRTCSSVSCHGNAIWSVTQFDCIGCHTGINGGARAIGPELGSGSSYKSHHITGIAVTKWHCIICHAEGDQSTGGTTGFHQKDGVVHLRNVDTPNSNWAIPATKTATDWTNIDTFCFRCHDAAGAAGIAMSSATALAAGTPTTGQAQNPFADTRTNSYDAVQRTTVVNIDSMFNTANYSHHAVKAPKYTAAGGLPFQNNAYSKTLHSLGATNVDDNSRLHCHDCHQYNGHGAAQNEYILQNSTGGDSLHGLGTYVCFKCHTAVYSTTTHSANGSASDFVNGRTGSYNYTGMSCAACHNCGGSNWGGIHGGNNTYTQGGGGTQSTYRFMPGLNNNGYTVNNWTAATATAGCYTNPTAGYGACTKHAGGDTGNALTRQGGARQLSY